MCERLIVEAGWVPRKHVVRPIHRLLRSPSIMLNPEEVQLGERPK